MHRLFHQTKMIACTDLKMCIAGGWQRVLIVELGQRREPRSGDNQGHGRLLGGRSTHNRKT